MRSGEVDKLLDHPGLRPPLLCQGNDILDESRLQYAISHRRSPICGYPFALFVIDPSLLNEIYKDVARGCPQIGDRRWLIANVIRQVWVLPFQGVTRK